MIELDTICEQIKEIAVLLWQGEAGAYTKINSYINEWQILLAQMIDEFDRKYQLDEESLNIVSQQIWNLAEAIQKKDDCMLADTLEHELLETLYYYKELTCNNE